MQPPKWLSINKIYSLVVLLGANKIVPFAVKRLGFQVDHSEFFIGHLAANRILAAIQPTGGGQAFGGCRSCNQPHQGLG